MPTHTRLIQSHLLEPRCQPAILDIVVEVRRTVPGGEQKSFPVSNKTLQELRNVRVQVNVTISRISFQTFDDARRISLDLLTNFNGASIIRKVFRIDSKRFRNSHSGWRK